MGDRCTGHCCKALPLPFSPEQLWRAYDRWKSGGEDRALHMGDAKPTDEMIYQDVHLVAPMLIYLGEFDEPLSRRVRVTDRELLGQPYGSTHFYRCKHFDVSTSDCSIYPWRPRMCRDYPYGAKCNYSACTWDAVRQMAMTRTEKNARRRQLKVGEKES